MWSTSPRLRRPRRTQEPRVDLVPVPVTDGVTLWVPAMGCEPPAAVLRQPPQLAVFDRIDVARAAVHARDGRDPARSDRDQRADGVVALDESLGRAVQPEAVRNTGAPVGDEREHVLLVEPDDRWRKPRGEVAEIGRDGEPEGPIELLSEPPGRPAVLHPQAEVRRAAVVRVVEADEGELPGRRERSRRDFALELRHLDGSAALWPASPTPGTARGARPRASGRPGSRSACRRPTRRPGQPRSRGR